MPDRKTVIMLGEQEIQRLEEAVLASNADSALQLLRQLLKPAMDKQLNRAHCKPTFEWDAGEDLRPGGPPESP